MNQTVTTLTPGTAGPAQALGFTAASVIVDNYTSSYVSLPDAGKLLPPWCYGTTVALPPGIRHANAVLIPTVPAVAGPPVPRIQCVITWTDQQLLTDPGHLLQQSQYGSQVVIGTVKGGANTVVGPQNIAVPAGTMSIGYLVRSDAGNDTPRTVVISGHQAGSEYASSAPTSNIGGPQWFLFAASDTSIDVTLTTNASNPSAVDILASPLVEVLDIVQAFGTLANVALWSGTGATGPLTIDNPSSGILLLGVSMAEAVPAPWQAAATSRGGTATPGALATDFTVITAPGAGISLRLFDMVFDTNSAAAVDLSLWDGPSAGGVNVARLRQRASTPPMKYNGSGAGLAANHALVGRLDAGDAGTTVTWSVARSQG